MSIVDRRLAGDYIKASGTPVDVARWAWQEADVPPPEWVLDQVRCDQDPRGSFAASWEPDRPSVDGTCERLAVLEDFGRLQTRTASRALDYLADRVGADGRVDEMHTPDGVAAPWTTPEDSAAGLARTALAGFWLALDGRPEAHSAAQVLAHQLVQHGTVGGFATQAVAFGLFHLTGRRTFAQTVGADLLRDLGGLDADQLAYLGWSLVVAGQSPDHELLATTKDLLSTMQADDGRWPSTTGHDVAVTLAALRTLADR